MSHVAGKVAPPPDVAITPVASAAWLNHAAGSAAGAPRFVRGPVVVPSLTW